MDKHLECYYECKPSKDVRWVQMRILGTLCNFERIAVPLCRACRKRLVGDWRNWKG